MPIEDGGECPARGIPQAHPAVGAAAREAAPVRAHRQAGETGRIVQSSSAGQLLGDPRIRQAYLGL